jgi:uncharacterized membrane protein
VTALDTRAEPSTAPAPALSPPRVVGGALLAAVVTAAVFRFWALGSQRLGFDEAFTAMTARRPYASMVAFLQRADSHPPLSYLLRAPLASAAVSNGWLRAPSALFSVAAVALFAWWMRRYGWCGVLATALMAVNAFQISHGRDVRMYAELELLGVIAAYLAAQWLERPRRWHAPVIGVVVLAGLLTHVSMFLLGAGLLTVAGRRRDRPAWAWRLALAAALVGWTALWGPSFVVQARTGHSDWIPPSSWSGFVHAVGQLATTVTAWHLVAVVVVGIGGLLIRRLDRAIARVWTCCFVVPIACAVVAGLFAPVLLDRTLTVVSWGAPFAVATAIVVGTRRAPWIGAVAAVVVLGVSIPPAIHEVTVRSTPDVVIRHLEAAVRPGDVAAVYPARRRPEIVWPLGVSRGDAATKVRLPELGGVAAVRLGRAPATGRVWLLDWHPRSGRGQRLPSCAPTWSRRGARVSCLQLPAP